MHGNQLLAAGKVIYLEPGKAGVSFDYVEPPNMEAAKLLGRQLTIVSREAGKSLRGHSEIRRLSYVDSILPGRDRVWIASGSADGWLPGDAALVRRGKTVITWGILSQVRDEVAILHLRTRINRSLALQPGDCVEQISVDDGGQVLSTRIARVEENNRVVLAGSRTNGWLVGQRLDISRDGEYVGFARIIAEEPLLIAETVSAFQRLAPAVGDEVSVRPPAYKRCVRVGWVFRAERGYCLLTLGSHDGVIQGQNLYSHGNVHATFSAGSLYADHCGAEFTLDGGGESAEMPLWTMVSTERQMSGSPLLKPLPVAHPKYPSWLHTVSAGKRTLNLGDVVLLDLDKQLVGLVVSLDEAIAKVAVLDRFDPATHLKLLKQHAGHESHSNDRNNQ